MATVIASVVIAGCGGSSTGDFTAKAEKVCTEGHTRLLAANPVQGNPGLNLQATAFEGMAGALQALTPPDDKKAAVGRLIADYRSAAGAQRSAALTNDKGQLAQALAKEQAAFVGVRADGAAAGLSTCAAQVTSS